MLVETTDIRQYTEEKLYNITVKSILSPLTMNFKHTQFSRENPDYYSSLVAYVKQSQKEPI